MRNRFFNPYVGPKYQEGINGKKILVLGASFYCNKDGKDGRPKCKFFEECTNPENKDSSKFNNICPFNDSLLLADEPTNEIDSALSAYKKFAKFLNQFVENTDEYAVWDQLAFTNYLQFFSPTWKTQKVYLSNRDFEAFIEILQELQPDIVISWGVETLNAIREDNPYVSKEELENLPKSEHYICHMKVPNVAHNIALINCYHPQSDNKYRRFWSDNKDIFAKYLRQVLEL